MLDCNRLLLKIKLYRFFRGDNHIRAANGFKTHNGGVALTTLVVTHYNFLRANMAIGYKVPIPMAEISFLDTIQAKWCKIIELARTSIQTV